MLFLTFIYNPAVWNNGIILEIRTLHSEVNKKARSLELRASSLLLLLTLTINVKKSQ